MYYATDYNFLNPIITNYVFLTKRTIEILQHMVPNLKSVT